jgi:hypothetical protein
MDSYMHRDTVANHKLAAMGKAHKDFKWYAFECVGPDIMFTGAVVTGIVSKGPRKGRPRYARESIRVVVTDAECDAAYLRYEAETGKCGDCVGKGEVFTSWNHLTGSKYRECSKCHGSGLLESPQAADAVARSVTNQAEPTTRV